MMASTKQLAVFDSSLSPGTPLVYEIAGGALRGTLRGIVRIGEPAEYDVPPGVYEVRLVHPRLGRLTKILDLTDEPDTVLFDDMTPEPMGPESGATSGGGAASALSSAPPRSSPWHLSFWPMLLPGEPRSLPPSRATTSMAPHGTRVVQAQLPYGAPGIALIDMDNAGAIAVCWPPGATSLEVQRTRTGVCLRPRTSDLGAESLLDYAMEGYPAHASLIRGETHANQLIDRERQSPAGALIGAYYLLKVREARSITALLGELWHNFPALPDAGVAYGTALLQADAEPSEIRDVFLAAARAGIPVYREGLRRLRAGLDHLFALAEAEGEEDHDVIEAIEGIRPFQMALRYDNAVTSWECRRESLEPRVHDRRHSSYPPAIGAVGVLYLEEAEEEEERETGTGVAD